MVETAGYTNEEKLKVAEREVKQRFYVYPRRVEGKKMTREKADYEIAVMQAIVEDYRTLAANERLL
jgi:ATP-dependent Lon protease